MLDIYQEYSNHIEEIFENSFDYIYLHDQNGNIIDVNDVIIRNLGYSKNEILSMKVTDFLVEETKSEIIGEVKNTMETGIVNKPKNFKVRKKNGDFVFVEANTIPLKRKGKLYAILGIGQDITERKQSEQKAKTSEKSFQVLFNNSTSGIAYHRIIYDQNQNPTDYIITDVNLKYEEILQIKRENVINKKSTEVYQVDPAPYLDTFSGVAETGEATSFETYFSPLNKYFNISVISPKKGEFISVFDDISERKKAENKLKESEEKFKALFKGSPVPALTWQKVGEDLQLIDYNKALLEYSQDDMRNYLGTNASVFFRNRPVLLEELYRCFEEKISITREIKYYVNIFEEERDFLAKFAYIAPDLVLLYVDDITERKEAEQKLKESEETFRSITEQSFMGIIVIQDGVFKYFNERAADINGYSVEEISNWQPYEFSKLIHPDDKDFVINQARKKQEGDSDVVNHHQYRIIKKNEEIIWVENFSKTINYQGKPADLVMTIDITEKIKSEQKIKESEKILKDFIHNATDSISIWDSNLNLIDINKAASDPWDSPNEPESGISMLRLAPLLKETERYEDYLKVIETGEPVSFDNVQIPPTTGERYFNIKAFKVGNGLGIIGTEITEHIRFEQELKESEEKFRTIAEQSFMGIVILQEGKIKYMNKTMATMSEFPIEEMLKWPDKLIIKMVHPDDVGYIVKRLQSNREGTMSQLSQNYFRIINKSGEIRWLEDYTSKIIYKGKVANLISVVDVTDKKQAEQLIIEENKRLLELEALRKDLITRVSHELKTPLTSIFGSLQILLSIFREKIDNDTLKYVNIGYSGCLRLKELIENLLDSSRLESKKLELKLQMEDLALLIDDCVNDMSYLADLRKQTIDINTPYRVNFEIDRLRFRQVITNIISNAIKNTPREGKVFINLSEEEEYIDIQVRDDGVGITEKEREILFEKFGKIERYGMDLDVDIEGSGLGLYISKEIVELHGGQILVLSEGRNKGTTFIIRLFKR